MNDQDQTTSGDFSHYCVLLADDNDLELEIISDLVESLGAQVDTADSGDELLQKLYAAPAKTYDLVLTDIYMLGKTGLEACREFRASAHPDAPTLPFIGISADNNPELYELAVNAGMNGMTGKPVSRRTLAAYLTILVTEGKRNAVFTARLQNKFDELKRLNQSVNSETETITPPPPASFWKRYGIQLSLIAFSILWLGAIIFLAVNALRLHELNAKARQSNNLSRCYSHINAKLQEGSNILSNFARRYTVLGSNESLREYTRESEATQNIQHAIEQLYTLPNSGLLLAALQTAEQDTQQIHDLETRALKLAVTARKLPAADTPQTIRQWQLTAAETALTPEQQLNLATQLLHGDEYHIAKTNLWNHVCVVLNDLVNKEQQQFSSRADEIARFCRFELVFLCFSALMLIVIFIGIVHLVKLTHAAQERELLKATIKQQSASIAAEKAKNTFFASISHTIRTPLNSIIGFSELLKNSNLSTEDSNTYLENIFTSGQQLLELTNDILDLARLEANSVILKPEPVDLAKLVKDVAIAYLPQTQQSGVTLNTQVPPRLLWPVVDRTRLRQILANLVSNAVKFTRQGEINVTVEAVPEAHRFTVKVRDTGCGISPRDLQRLTQPYARLSFTDQTKRTGLGLSISRQLLVKMGGQLDIASREGKGSIFTITLKNVQFHDPGPATKPKTNTPVIPDSAVLSAKAASTVAPLPDFCADLRVLVIDDMPLNLTVLSQMLKRLGLNRLSCASSGQQALDLLKENSYDLVLTDMWMPEIGGEELVRILRSQDGYKKLPIFAVTADIEYLKTYRELGFTGILLKPITTTSLSALLAALPNPDSLQQTEH